MYKNKKEITAFCFEIRSKKRTLARVESRTSCVDMGTEPLGALGGTCQIGQTGVERDISGVLDELIRCRVVTPMARTGNLGSAIENELDRKVNLFTLSLAGNLDAIGESRDGTMSPARATILRQMLVQRMGEVGLAIDVSPSEGIGKIVIADVGVWER